MASDRGDLHLGSHNNILPFKADHTKGAEMKNRKSRMTKRKGENKNKRSTTPSSKSYLVLHILKTLFPVSLLVNFNNIAKEQIKNAIV